MQRIIHVKFVVTKVERLPDQDRVYFEAVQSDQHSVDGIAHDNNFAQWWATAEMVLTIRNPAMLGKISPGDQFSGPLAHCE